MIGGYNLPADAALLAFTACLLTALMRRESRPLDFIVNSNQELVEILLDLLRRRSSENNVSLYFLGEDENGCSPIKIRVARNIEARTRIFGPEIR